MLLGPLAIAFLVYEASRRIAANPVQDVYLPWVIIVMVFAPVAAGMSVFGYYAFKGEYDTREDELYSGE